MKLATWNVRSLYRAGSLKAAARELGRYKLDIEKCIAGKECTFKLLTEYHFKSVTEHHFQLRFGGKLQYRSKHDNFQNSHLNSYLHKVY